MDPTFDDSHQSILLLQHIDLSNLTNNKRVGLWYLKGFDVNILDSFDIKIKLLAIGSIGLVEFQSALLNLS